MDIGEMIRETRKKKGIKQLELSKAARISNTYLSDIEVGRTSPSLKTLLKITEALGIEVSDFLKNFDKNS